MPQSKKEKAMFANMGKKKLRFIPNEHETKDQINQKDQQLKAENEKTIILS